MGKVKTILFGCALVSYEEMEMFEWVFRTWLLCMGDRSPQVILTDRASSLRKALATRMPLARDEAYMVFMVHCAEFHQELKITSKVPKV